MGLADPGVDCAPLFTAFRGASAAGAAFCLRLKKQHQIRRKRKTKNQWKGQRSYTYLARGAALFWELRPPWGPPEAPGTAAVVSACATPTKAPAPAPGAGPGSATPSGATDWGAPRIRPPTPSPPLGDPRGLNPPEVRYPRHPR